MKVTRKYVDFLIEYAASDAVDALTKMGSLNNMFCEVPLHSMSGYISDYKYYMRKYFL